MDIQKQRSYELKSRKLREHRFLKDGRCLDCRRKKELVRKKKRHCSSCQEKRNKQAKEDRVAKKKNGKCVRCKHDADAGYYCVKHWFMNTSYNHFKEKGKAPILEELWKKQKGRCAYTGEKLYPGKNASIDHIRPISKGGISSKKNLQWVTKKVNDMKRNFTHREFISLCKKIALHHP